MKKAYTWSLVVTVILTLLAVLTVWPMQASKPNGLGYYSHCSWAPWSTLILLLGAGIMCIIRNRLLKKQTA